MRHIPLLKNPPPAEWLAKACAATAEVETETDPIKRKEPIKTKADVWGELARRKANLMQHPASGLTREDVQRRVRSRYGR